MMKPIRLGLQIGSTDPFWVLVREAIYERANQLSLDLIPIDIERPSMLSDEEQTELFEEILAQELNSLICWDLPAELAYRVLEREIPVIHLIESDLEHPLFTSPRGLYDIACMLGEYLVKHLNGAGNVLLVGGLREGSGEDGRSRIQGFRDITKPYSGIDILHIPTRWNYQQAYDEIIQYFEKRPEPTAFDAVYGLSDSLALAGRDALAAVGLLEENAYVVGINGDPLALSAIYEGTMTASVETSALDFGTLAVDQACRAADGQPLSCYFSYKPVLVTAKNVSKIATQKLTSMASLPNRLIGQTRQQQQQRLNQLETSLQISRSIGAFLNLRQLCQETAESICSKYGYDSVQIAIWDEAEVQFDMIQSGFSYATVSRIPVELSGLLKNALVHPTIIFIPDAKSSQRFERDSCCPNVRTRLVIPIQSADKLWGFLDLKSEKVMHHSQSDIRALRSLADQVAVAMHNAELYQQAVEACAVAEKANSMKTRLLANISHELRTPLNVILGYSSAALSQTAHLSPKLESNLTHIHQSGEHLRHLIDDLLDLSRAEIGELDIFPKTMNTHSLLREIFQEISILGSSGVAYHLQLPSRLPFIRADPVRFRQIFLNLLSNAQKFTTRGEIVLGAEVQFPYLHLWVHDTGSGIPHDLQELIFEPFVTFDHRDPNVPSGVGLGLSITRRLVLLHGGRMSLDSHINEGTTIHVYLPLPGFTGENIPVTVTKPTLLLIGSQGEPNDSAIGEIAERQSWKIHPIQRVNDLSALPADLQPVVVALELNCFGQNYVELVRNICDHPQLRRLPLLLYGNDENVDVNLNAGLTNILAKPLQHETLLEIINSIAPTGATSVLIVDDDASTCDLYCELIRSAFPEYRILTAKDGASALQVLDAETPSLLILDLAMPGMDGFALLEHVRANSETRRLPVMIVSGKTLTYEDIQRLNYPQVTFRGKDILTTSEFAISIDAAIVGTNTLAPYTSLLIKQAIFYIQSNFAQDFSRSNLASTLGVNKDYLSRIFHQELGISPWEYLTRYRVRQAQTLIRQSEDSISEIAARVGYNDPAYFSRVFKQYVGFSPRAYRNQQSVP